MIFSLPFRLPCLFPLLFSLSPRVSSTLMFLLPFPLSFSVSFSVPLLLFFNPETCKKARVGQLIDAHPQFLLMCRDDHDDVTSFPTPGSRSIANIFFLFLILYFTLFPFPQTYFFDLFFLFFFKVATSFTPMVFFFFFSFYTGLSVFFLS